MPSNPVISWEMAARDAKKQQAFYSQLFDWKVDTSTAEGWKNARVATGSWDGSIFQTDPPPWHGIYFYVEVADMQAHLDKVVRLGGKVAWAGSTSPEGRTAVIQDPEGNFVGLWSGPPKKD